MSREEIRVIVQDNNMDTMIFCLSEYGEKDRLKMEKIVNDFCEEYTKLFYKLIDELLEEE